MELRFQDSNCLCFWYLRSCAHAVQRSPGMTYPGLHVDRTRRREAHRPNPPSGSIRRLSTHPLDDFCQPRHDADCKAFATATQRSSMSPNVQDTAQLSSRFTFVYILGQQDCLFIFCVPSPIQRKPAVSFWLRVEYTQM